MNNTDPDQEIFAGIDVGGTRVKLGLITRQGGLLAADIFPVQHILSYAAFVDTLSDRLARLARTCDRGEEWTALGIGSPGRIDHERGTVAWLEGKLEFLAGQPLGHDFRQRLGKPVFCDNDVNTILLGEARFGAGRTFSNLVGITLGTGIGGAVILDGKLRRGSNHAVGHFGFMSHHVHGGIAHVSGNPGAVENHASHTGLLERVREKLLAGTPSVLEKHAADSLGVREIFEAADRQDALAMELVHEMQEEVALLVANLIFALDPDAVLIGGGFIRRGDHFVRTLETRVKERIAFLPPDVIRVLPMELGDHAGIFGGAALALTSISRTT